MKRIVLSVSLVMSFSPLIYSGGAGPAVLKDQFDFYKAVMPMVINIAHGWHYLQKYRLLDEESEEQDREKWRMVLDNAAQIHSLYMDPDFHEDEAWRVNKEYLKLIQNIAEANGFQFPNKEFSDKNEGKEIYRYKENRDGLPRIDKRYFPVIKMRLEEIAQFLVSDTRMKQLNQEGEKLHKIINPVKK